MLSLQHGRCVVATFVVASAAVAITSAEGDSQLSAGDVLSSSTAAAALLLLYAPLSVAATTTVANSDINQDVVGGNAVKGAGTTTCSIITRATKTSLRGYFEGVNWLLNKALPRGAEFMCGPLGDIVRKYNLQQTQVLRQLQNYKKGKFLNVQVCILLNPSDLDEWLREGIPTIRILSQIKLAQWAALPSQYYSSY